MVLVLSVFSEEKLELRERYYYMFNNVLACVLCNII